MKARHLVIAVVLFVLLAGSAAFAHDPAPVGQAVRLGPDRSRQGPRHGSRRKRLRGRHNPWRDRRSDTARARTRTRAGRMPSWPSSTPRGRSSGSPSSARGRMISSRGSPSTAYGLFLYVAGWTKGSMPGGAEQPAPAGEYTTPAVPMSSWQRFTPSGTIRWIRQFGTAKDDFAYGVATDRSGLVYVVGSTTGASTA